MKKAKILLMTFLLVFGLFAALPAAADESEFYYTSVQILKIFPHQLGYYVLYRCPGSVRTAEFFIPKGWFDRRDQRAVLNLTDQNVNPYLSIMTKKGEFNHVRLTLPRNITDPVWGTLPSGAPYDDKFGVEKLTLEY